MQFNSSIHIHNLFFSEFFYLVLLYQKPRPNIQQNTKSLALSPSHENEIGVKIFNRKTKPVSVTPEGERIIDRLRIVNHEVESLENLIQELIMKHLH